MIDSYEHTKINHIPDEVDDGNGHQANAQDMSHLEATTTTTTKRPKSMDDPKVIKHRIVSSYKIAGSMMLVSSVTTAICFFSNVFSAVISIRDFGSYMGVVVVLNFIQ